MKNILPKQFSKPGLVLLIVFGTSLFSFILPNNPDLIKGEADVSSVKTEKKAESMPIYGN